MTWFRVHITRGQVPGLPAGRRLVYLERKGKNTARLRCPYTLVAVNIKRGVWEAIATSARAMPRPRNIKRHVRSLCRGSAAMGAEIQAMLEDPGRRR